MKIGITTYGMAVALLGLVVSVLAQGTTTPAGTVPSTASQTTAKPKTTRKASSAAKTPRVTGTAYLRVLHAIADAPQVDVFVNGQKAVSGATFKSVSEYMPLPSGSKLFKISASGKTDALFEGKKTLGKDKYYTAIAAGTAAKPTFIVQNESAGKAAASNLTFGKSAMKTVTPNTLTLQLRATDDKVLQEVSGAKFEADKRYAAFVIGTPGGSGARALDLLIVPAAAK